MKNKSSSSDDTLRPEYDFSGGVRGKHAGKVTVTRVIKANGSKAVSAKATKKGGDLDEAVSLLLRVRPYLSDTQRAGKLKEQIESFLDRVI